MSAKTVKPVAKPTRWWACVDTLGKEPPAIYSDKREASGVARFCSERSDLERRFVVKRVEIKEV